MTRMISLLLVAALCLGSNLAIGQRPGPGRADGPRAREDVRNRLIKLFDRNRDGQLNRVEWRRARHVLLELKPEGRRQGERGRMGPEGRRTGPGGERMRPEGDRVRPERSRARREGNPGRDPETRAARRRPAADREE
jgi:hypothetical protein